MKIITPFSVFLFFIILLVVKILREFYIIIFLSCPSLFFFIIAEAHVAQATCFFFVVPFAFLEGHATVATWRKSVFLSFNNLLFCCAGEQVATICQTDPQLANL